MRYSLSFLSLLALTAGFSMFSSCEKECFSTACLDDAPDVRLDQPQTGQRSYFLRYESTCDKPSGDFEYTGDTLILEVIEAGPTVRFKESFTTGSPLWQPDIGGPPTEEGYVVYPFEDYLLLPERQSSNLFFFYGNDTLWLNRPTTRTTCPSHRL